MQPWLERFARANFNRSADTAHDLKTPLNIAVLNLELLRMRLRKLSGGDEDEKIAEYAAAIETELRRMGQIFDAFFLLSTPPSGDEASTPVDVAALCPGVADAAGGQIEDVPPARVAGHEARIRQALRLFFDGATRLFDERSRSAKAFRDQTRFHVMIRGTPRDEEFEPSKIFKFYYTDPEGNPDLSMAASRLIAETYGGEVVAAEERDKVWDLRLSLPLDER